MKNRRIVLSTLLLIAVLVMGIAFATLVDTLSITGTATFRPANVVALDVDAAIYFTEEITTGDYCVSATRKADVDQAGMTVVFNDAGETDRVYVSTATFTVVYQPATEGAHLPAVKLDTVANALLTSGGEAPGFTVKVDHVHIDEPAVPGMFSPGESMQIIVTVTCDATEVENGTTANSIANILVELNYSTVAED